MSSPERKRQLPPKVAKMMARKKQKLDGKAPSRPSTAIEQSMQHPKYVNLEKLQWKPVSLPDQMDDYGGFFGLEEIEGVDVVQEPESNRVSYRLTHHDDAAKVSDDVYKKETPKKKPNSKASRQQSGVDAEEWNGFDSETGQEDHEQNLLGINESTMEKQKHPKAVNGVATDKKKPITQNRNNLGETAFDLLADEDGDNDIDVSAWYSLGLSPEVLASLSKMKFIEPTQIQSSTIPQILAGYDLIGKAPTGSGKTLAFGIPIIESWLSRRDHSTEKVNRSTRTPVALIVLPTRELALQISSHLGELISNANLDDVSIATLTGGLSIQKQRRLLSEADVVVGTPGRLWEVISEGHGVLESLKAIKFLVVDEADRLLSDGHFKELEDILQALDKQITDEKPDATIAKSSKYTKPKHDRQTLVFSATFSKDLQEKLSRPKPSKKSTVPGDRQSMSYLLQKLNFRSPKPRFVNVNPVAQLPTTLREGILECPVGTDKDLYTYGVLLQHPPSTRALVFVNSISAVRRVVPFLANLNLTAYPLHSQMEQKARLRSVERLSAERGSSNTSKHKAQNSTSPKISSTVLVATDVAARGLDIPNVELVLHYHVPRSADTYVHRSGRTARAEKPGTSILLCAPEEASGVRRLVAQVHASGATSAKRERKEQNEALRPLSLDAALVSRLRPRAVLAKMLADAANAKAKLGKEDAWMKAAADELGIDAEEDGLPDAGGRRGKARREREKEASGATKAQMKTWRAELNALLSRRLNTGVSEKYLTSSGIDIDALLKEREGAGSGIGGDGRFLGNVRGLGFD